jgi:hypothetical protein
VVHESDDLFVGGETINVAHQQHQSVYYEMFHALVAAQQLSVSHLRLDGVNLLKKS